jgi:mitochondrial fission protein ELM1
MLAGFHSPDEHAIAMPAAANQGACWALHDGAAGNRRQAVALASALGMEVREWSLRPNALSRWLAPRRVPGAGFQSGFAQALAESPPALAIGCGRQAALATRLAREAGARSVQILDPRLASTHWDLVVAPAHDRLEGPNVLTLLGSLNEIDEAWLRHARERWRELAALPGPRTALLVGGPTAATPFDEEDLARMCEQLEATLARDGGRLLVCGSRRTPPAWVDALRARFDGSHHALWFDAADGDNLYEGALACADRIVLTPDSVNMLSEACATALPVFVAAPARASGRIASFLQALVARGRVRAQSVALEDFEAEPLRESARIAARVRQALNLR